MCSTAIHALPAYPTTDSDYHFGNHYFQSLNESGMSRTPEEVVKTINEQYPLFDVENIATLQDVIVKSAAKFGNNLALQDLKPTPIQSLTYNDFLNAIKDFGSSLLRAGVEEHAHIAVISENRVQWTLAYLTLASFNYVAVPIDRNLNEHEILTILHASDSRGAIFSEGYRDMRKLHWDGLFR